MRKFKPVQLFVATLLFFGGFLVVPRANAVVINGQTYVSLIGWAREHGFHGYTLHHGDEIVVTNKTSRLVFDVDSVQAEIKGVNVRLCFAVASQKGVPLISRFDLEKTIAPLIYPWKLSKHRIKTIYLDPGHGGKDTGNRVGSGTSAHNEKAYTLSLAYELRRQLQADGFKVLLTRNSDVFVELPDRPAKANRAGADLFLSLHFNSTASNKNSVSGLETYCITPVGAASSNVSSDREYNLSIKAKATVANRKENESLMLAYQVQKSLVDSLHAEDRCVRRARFAVLRDAKMPAILIEGGYMSNPKEGKKIYSAAYRKQMAAAIKHAILDYQKLTELSAAKH